ncbi:hypothetical protein P5673_028754, partial [Acropora cervicornis]
FAAPFTLKAKKLLQDLCKDELPESYRNRWENWRSELPMLERMLVPRCVKPIDFGEVKSRQVQVFSDASSVGYGSVAYLRLCDNEGRIHCSFLMGKARLAPIKACVTTITDPSPASTVTKLFQHFSDWCRQKKAVAVFLRVKTILQQRRLKRINEQHVPSATANDKASKLNIGRSSLTVQELEEAEQSIIPLITN